MDDQEFKVSELTKADRATLRRCVGRTLAESPKAISLFYSLVPNGLPKWKEERFFAVLCIAALWDDDRRGTPFELCMKRMKDTFPTMDNRMKSILSVRWSDEDGFLCGKLGSLARMMKSGNSLKPDAEQLYTDLVYWNSENQSVQKNWARKYYTSENKSEEGEN
ncbi:MAG: type I-E CRISPR-associated protein Cse2/CasB [Solobacterium sp.]|nr:type I-E CRISPR-associated protein Cse2/CasB [Solobacterium sp.]MCH4222136.1 type I-E CRISPR-associated protein Cse2/CasB [Solobacterium sp.]